MVFKLLAFSALIAAVRAGNLIAPYAAASPITYQAPIARYAAPVAYAKAVVAEEYDANPQYSFGYDVQDSLTGDSKSQSESRSGDVVQGSYSLVDPDGTKRTVDYIADSVNGFNAVVRKEPLVAKAAVVSSPAVAKVATPVAYATPVAHNIVSRNYAAPLARNAAAFAYATPSRVVYSAPLAYRTPVTKFGAPLSYSTSVIH